MRATLNELAAELATGKVTASHPLMSVAAAL